MYDLIRSPCLGISDYATILLHFIFGNAKRYVIFLCYYRLFFLLLLLSFFCIFKHRDTTATTARGVLISMCSCLANQAGIIATSITTSRGKLFLLSFLLFPFDFFCLFIFGPVTNGYKASAHLVGLIVGDNSDCWQLISTLSPHPLLSLLHYYLSNSP